MKFDYLLTSIRNNADTKPSILLALSMVQSLFEDVTRAAGKDDISLCAADDEELPSKLIWLSRNLLWIYEENSAIFQSGRGRLESVIAKLKHTEQELESLEQIGQQLRSCQEQYDVLLRKLPAARSRAAEYKEVCARLSQARDELAELELFDPDQAGEELTRLTGRITQLDSQRTTLREQIFEKQQTEVSLNAEVSRLENEAETLDQQLRSQTSNKEALDHAIQKSLVEQDQLSVQLSELEAAKASLTDEFERKSNDVKTAADQVEEYRKHTLEPVQAQLSELQGKLHQLEEKKESAENEYRQINQQRSDLILQIARMKSTCETAETDLENTRKNYRDTLREKEKQAADLEQAINDLSALQNEVIELKNVRLPEAQGLLEDEGARKKLLEKELLSIQQRCSEMTISIEQLNQDLPGQREALQNTKAVYDDLTADYTASTQELKKLEREIQVLQSRSDAEKLATYSQQMKDKLADLEKLRIECEELAEKNRQLDQELSGQQDRYTKLLEQQKKHDTVLENTRQMIARLQFAANPAYLRQMDLLLTRLSTLEMIHNELSASISRIRQVCGASPVTPDAVLEDQVKTELSSLVVYTNDLRNALIRCSESLKMEDTK